MTTKSFYSNLWRNYQQKGTTIINKQLCIIDFIITGNELWKYKVPDIHVKDGLHEEDQVPWFYHGVLAMQYKHGNLQETQTEAARSLQIKDNYCISENLILLKVSIKKAHCSREIILKFDHQSPFQTSILRTLL